MAVAPADSGDADEYPAWFTAFLADRAVRKPSPHTIKAYRQDFAAIAALLAGNANRIGNLTPADITADRMRSAFATYADAHEPSSIRRCWPTWNPERDVPGVPRPGPGPVVASHKRIVMRGILSPRHTTAVDLPLRKGWPLGDGPEPNRPQRLPFRSELGRGSQLFTI
jgi:hypothetical protein